MDAILRHGDFSVPYETENPRLRERSDDLDQLTLYFAAPSQDAFLKKTAAPAPWSHFEIVDLDKERDGDEWLFSLACEGLNDNTDRIIGKPYAQEKLEAWDDLSFEVITDNPRLYRAGDYVAGPWTMMVCTAVVPRGARGRWYRLQISGLGISTPKDRKRVITCNGMTIQSDSVKWNFPGGWNTPRKGVVDLPQIQVTDTYWGSTPPPTGEVPGSKVPPNTPPIKSLGSILVADSTSYWPNGWKFTCGGSQVGNSSLWENTFTYTGQWANLPS